MSQARTQRTLPLRRMLLPLLVGIAVAVAVGLVAREEAIAPGTYPGGYFRLFFSDSLHLKAWFATAALAVAILQPLGAAWMFGLLPWRRPRRLGTVHRVIGYVVLLLTLPVAYHCVFKLGLQESPARVAAHAFLGCAFYGAFAAKILIVRLRSATWALVGDGSLLFGLLTALWFTSAFWFFTNVSFGR